MSNNSCFQSSVEKFDGTNWEDWSYSIESHFQLMHILCIAEGTEIRPKPAAANAPTEAESRTIEDWDRRNDEGLGLIQLSIKTTIRQSINRKETLAQNWKRL